MKKINDKGFVLAETLVVTVFLMTLFAMIYSNFFPLIGEYEKRETYDDVDSKYGVYWLKKMIESPIYDVTGDTDRETSMNEFGFVRFNCQDLTDADYVTICKDIVKSLLINGCDKRGDNCDIYITKYRIGKTNDRENIWFKNIVAENYKRYRENCSLTKNDDSCKALFIASCKSTDTESNCTKKSEKPLFSDGFKDYIVSLPDFVTPSSNNAKYRVIAVFHNRRDNNNYYSYSTIEVNRN